jgi:acyl carrier protein
MGKKEALLQVQDIFRDVMENEDIEIMEVTTSNDIDEWDSLAHIQLVVAIEKRFKIKFTAQELVSWKNVGEMIDCILTK